MLGIDVKDLRGHAVRWAPFGVEGDPVPCMVWTDPLPALAQHCRVLGPYCTPLLVRTERRFLALVCKHGLVVDQVRGQYWP